MSGNPNGTLVAHTPTGGEPRPTATACGPASDTTPDLVIAMLRRVAELALQLVPLAVPNPDGTPAYAPCNLNAANRAAYLIGRHLGMFRPAGPAATADPAQPPPDAPRKASPER
ncbi:MAG: hypothetical protein FJ318_08475, partial [SAR202 cluster bacterium]|nr:hypothetical protein [SAR202 cluster bacterium]